MWMRNHVINRVVRAVAHSPAHPLLGMHLVVLGYTGRRSGRRRELPVMAASAGTDLVVLVGQHRRKTWWRNFDGLPQAVGDYRRQFPRAPVDVDAPVLVLGVSGGGAGRRRPVTGGRPGPGELGGDVPGP